MPKPCECPPEAVRSTCESSLSLAKPSPDEASACPQCHQVGKLVKGCTVSTLLGEGLRMRQATTYLFCRTTDCPVVYFATTPAQAFLTDQVRERVYQKAPADATVFVCYCFRHTVGDICSASSDTRSSIVADITSGIAAEQCACDLRNPQGSCCLGNVRALLRQLDRELSVREA